MTRFGQKLWVISLLMLACVSPVWAANGQIAATSTSATVGVDGRHIVINNIGATNEAYLRITIDGASAGTAVTTDFVLPAGSGLAIDLSDQHEFAQLSVVCAAAETTTVTYISTD